MVITQIRALYRDENDLLRTFIKRVYEEWNAQLEQWRLKRIEFLFPDDDLPVHTDSPEASLEASTRLGHPTRMGCGSTVYGQGSLN